MAMLILPAVALALMFAPLVGVLRGKVEGKKAKSRIVMNLCMFAGMCILGIVCPLAGALAAGEETAAVANGIVGTMAQGLGFIAAALSTGLACVGGGIAVAAAAPAAIGAVSENSKNFGRAIIFVVLGEGMAIYGLVISFLIILRLG